MLILLLCNNQVFLSANEVKALTILHGDIFANVTSLEEVYSEILLPLIVPRFSDDTIFYVPPDAAALHDFEQIVLDMMETKNVNSSEACSRIHLRSLQGKYHIQFFGDAETQRAQ